MFADLSSRQIADWMAYYTLEPFGNRADDCRHGIAVAAAMNRGRGKNERVYSADTFRLHRPEAVPEQDEQTIFAKLKALLGGKK